MKPMILKEFYSLGKRDFENGAVLDSIAIALKDREALRSTSTNKQSELLLCDRCGENPVKKKMQLCSSCWDDIDAMREKHFENE